MPVAIIITLCIVLSVKEYGSLKEKFIFSHNEMISMAAIMVMIVIWTAFSGIGGYLWQNSDHKTRNTLFDDLIKNIENNADLRKLVNSLIFAVLIVVSVDLVKHILQLE